MPWAAPANDRGASPRLDDGCRVAVVGGGPAGSFFTYFLLEIAHRLGIEVHVDVYEARDFARIGPAGCNMCGGIISESLVQALAVEGITLPPTVVQRGIDSYFLHMDVGRVRIQTPLGEKRIGAIHRGAGPRGAKEVNWGSFDGYLLELALAKGAHLVRERVDALGWDQGRPQVKSRTGSPQTYDLLVAAVGVNTGALKLFSGLGLNYRPPCTSRTYLSEFYLGQDVVERYLGSSMHIFLLNIPRLEFGALIPKGDYVTLCLLGQDIDKGLVRAFLDAPEVKECLPPDWQLSEDFCHCSPSINVRGACAPFADRIVFIGDCGVSRLYKDGIGAAYRTAKAAAKAAIFHGISAEDFRRHYWPACQAISRDNRIGEWVFALSRQMQKRRFARRGILQMVAREQGNAGDHRGMSLVLWDTFTGSAPYREVFWRTLQPAFLGRFLWNIAAGLWPSRPSGQ